MQAAWIEFFEGRAKTMPDDIEWDGAILAIAKLLDNASSLTTEQRATLAGIGALAYRTGLEKFKAGNQAAMYLDKFRHG